MSYKIGNIVEGVVTGVQTYGAFISLDENTQGLIHISELKQGYVQDIHKILKVGERVRVLVLDVDEYSGKISLSMRALEEATTHPYSNRKKIKRYGRRTGVGFSSLANRLDGWILEAIDFLKDREKTAKSNKKMEE